MRSTSTSQRIIVGVDGSPESVAALGWAARFARATEATVRAVLAWHHLDGARSGAAPTVAGTAGEETERRMRADLAEAVAKVYPDPAAIETSVIFGNPAQVLVDLSREADMLVVGSHAHGAYAEAQLGSVSLHCVSRAHCTVTVVRGPHTP